jgi:hypothetical protein
MLRLALTLFRWLLMICGALILLLVASVFVSFTLIKQEKNSRNAVPLQQLLDNDKNVLAACELEHVWDASAEFGASAVLTGESTNTGGHKIVIRRIEDGGFTVQDGLEEPPRPAEVIKGIYDDVLAVRSRNGNAFYSLHAEFGGGVIFKTSHEEMAPKMATATAETTAGSGHCLFVPDVRARMLP